jgi:glycosyltransferase involved in cell wall biosynthesis
LQQELDPNQARVTAGEARAGAAGRSTVLLLDLSGSPDTALAWAGQTLGADRIRSISKADLKWGSKLTAIKKLRLMKPEAFVVFCHELQTQSAVNGFQIFGALAGARTVILADHGGNIIRCSRYWALFAAPLVLGLQIALGYIVLAPLSWLFTFVLEALSPIVKDGLSTIGTHQHNDPIASHGSPCTGGSESERSNLCPPSLAVLDPPRAPAQPRRGLYLRATPATAAVAGGMATHVSGFAGGAAALGHHLEFVSSGPLQGIPPESQVHLIPLSATLSATRTLFELWNSFMFTVSAVRFYRQHRHDREWDFIYQRYNRFNCAGVLLSTLSGLPLLLEYNGSEVWVGRNWDPIGMAPLLGRFERTNQRRADLITVVSSAEGRNLLALGVPAERIVVNPNGVDTGQFHPGCGGCELRSELGLASNIVVGFLGSFGPWHGTEVLARAATMLGPDSRCHFLFVGTGDLRARTESIFSEAHCSSMASFAGTIPHSSIPRYLDACDILVAPHLPMPDGSAYFGSPTKLFEYLAMARPVVASRLGQMAEILTDGENAILVEPGDPAALAAAIINLATDEPLRRRLGANARSLVMSKYTWRHNAARVFSALEHLLNHPIDPVRPRAAAGGQAGA